jgi:hypothetical protein
MATLFVEIVTREGICPFLSLNLVQELDEEDKVMSKHVGVIHTIVYVVCAFVWFSKRK